MKILLVKGFPLLTSVGVLAKELKKRGHEVHLLVPREHADCGRMRAAGFRVHVLPFRRGWRLTADLVRLARLLRKERFRIVHLNLSRARLCGRIASVFSPRSIVVSSIRGLDARYEKWTNWRDDATVAVSESVRQFLLAAGMPEHKLETIPNGLDLEEIDAVPRDACYLHRELGLPSHARLVGMVAFFREHLMKGHKIFFDAAKIVAAEFPETHFVLVGGNLSSRGFNQQYFERYAEQLGLSGRVHFLGNREDVCAIMSSLAAHVLPSYREGCPMAVLEAMARGTPTIGSAIESISEIIEHGRSGLLFESGNHEALADCLRALFTRPALSDALAREGRKRIESAYRAIDMGLRYEKLYLRLAERKWSPYPS